MLAKLDYLLATKVSRRAQQALLAEVARTAYRLEQFSAEDVASAAWVLKRYSDLEIGLADASIGVLADRYGVLEVLTLDHRHLHALRGPGGRRFRLHTARLLERQAPVVGSSVLKISHRGHP